MSETWDDRLRQVEGTKKTTEMLRQCQFEGTKKTIEMSRQCQFEGTMKKT